MLNVAKVTKTHFSTVLPRIENLSKNKHSWESEKEYLKKYDHHLWKKFENQASGSGHGGMDFFVLRDFINSVKKGTNPPLDVYDAASMSVISPLSEKSIRKGSAAVLYLLLYYYEVTTMLQTPRYGGFCICHRRKKHDKGNLIL